MNYTYDETSKMLKALSDPKRLKIIDMLSKGELCARNIQGEFDISQPTLSHDMRVLKEAGLTIERRHGKNIFYALNTEVLKNLISTLDVVFETSEDEANAERA